MKYLITLFHISSASSLKANICEPPLLINPVIESILQLGRVVRLNCSDVVTSVCNELNPEQAIVHRY